MSPDIYAGDVKQFGEKISALRLAGDINLFGKCEVELAMVLNNTKILNLILNSFLNIFKKLRKKLGFKIDKSDNNKIMRSSTNGSRTL